MIKFIFVFIAFIINPAIAAEPKTQSIDLKWNPKCAEMNPGHWLKGYSSCLDAFDSQAKAKKEQAKGIEATCKCIADGYTQDLNCEQLTKLREDSKKSDQFERKVAYKCIARLKM